MGSSCRNKKRIFDEIRKVWVAATGEEQVRQWWIRHMVCKLQYPKGAFVVEKRLKELPFSLSREAPNRRVDILVLGKGDPPFPLLLLECKEQGVIEDALNQVIGYNHFVGAPCVAVVNAAQVRFGRWDRAKNQYVFYPFLPSYQELMQWVRY